MDIWNFKLSCKSATIFPRCLVRHSGYEHTLEAYVQRLDQEEKRLFYGEKNADLKCWEFDERKKDFEDMNFVNFQSLQTHLCGAQQQAFQKEDPKSRTFFVHAPNSRKELKVTRQMLMQVFAYHQVMPGFVDFLFPFGRQVYPKDFYFSAFKSETLLPELDEQKKALKLPVSDRERALVLPDLHRSGREFRMCYNLKSVEPSTSQWPWSIRHTAAYHSFDVDYCNAFWVIVKGEISKGVPGAGDSLVRERIMKATKKAGRRYIDLSSSKKNAFLATLEVHNVIIDIATEGWRWYVNYLEEIHQKKTRPALFNDYSTPFVPKKTEQQPVLPVQKRGTFEFIRRSTTWARGRRSSTLPIGSSAPNTGSPITLQQLPPPPQPAPSATVQEDVVETEDERNTLTIYGVQECQAWEEKAREALLVLDSNINILNAIRDYYNDLFANERFPADLRKDCADEIKKFCKNISSIVDDLKMQRSRAATLQSVLRDRKTLAFEIFSFQNMEASKEVALKAEHATTEMNAMTKQMNILAHKTQRETVSMKIITLVTLFFLPGTFISTIMSTDIIKYPVNSSTGVPQEQYSSSALGLYLKITLPLMAVTFLAWGVLLWMSAREEKQEKLESDSSKDGSSMV